jgi:hypothetical protein
MRRATYEENGAMPDPADDAAAKKAAEDQAAATKEAADKAAADAEAAKKAEAEKGLGDAGKAALDAERKRARDAEKALKDAQAKLDEIEKSKLSETDKLKKDAEEGKQLAATATQKLRKANLILALADEGLTGGKAKAAARLLDTVDYDDNDEPTNLKDAITAATAEYGEDMFKGATPPPPPDPPDLHHGPRSPVTDDEDAALAAMFPQLSSRDAIQT